MDPPPAKLFTPTKLLFPLSEAGRVTVGKGGAAACRAAVMSIVLATQVAGRLLAQSMVSLVWKQVT